MSKKIFCTQSSTPPVMIHFFPFHHGDKADQRGASVDNQTRHHRPQQSTTPTSASSAIVATIGNFDGFHRGHQFVIDRLQTTARARGLPAWLITFDPHPRLLFDNNLNNFVITDRNEKITAARQYGLDGVAVIDFDHALASLSAETFVRDILKTQLQVDTLLLGEDFRFGRDRGGNIETLRQHGIDHVIPLPLQTLSTNNHDASNHDEHIISSSRLRKAISAGDMVLATTLMGRSFAVHAPIINGDQWGRTIGFPTANLDVGLLQSQKKILPPTGIYATRASIAGDDKLYDGSAYHGLRAGLKNQQQPEQRLEVHLFDFAGDIYGKDITIFFIVQLRGDKVIHNLDDLKIQIATDNKAVKKILASHAPLCYGG